MNNNDNNGEITVNPEEIARKIKSNAGDLKKTLKKYITKREIIIVAAVALVIFSECGHQQAGVCVGKDRTVHQSSIPKR